MDAYLALSCIQRQISAFRICQNICFLCRIRIHHLCRNVFSGSKIPDCNFFVAVYYQLFISFKKCHQRFLCPITGNCEKRLFLPSVIHINGCITYNCKTLRWRSLNLRLFRRFLHSFFCLNFLFYILCLCRFHGCILRDLRNDQKRRPVLHLNDHFFIRII